LPVVVAEETTLLVVVVVVAIEQPQHSTLTLQIYFP
jgi:hypothetical protein